MSGAPWYAYLLFINPQAVSENLDRARRAGLVDEPPNLWQLSLAVFRMWHRLLFRSQTVGTCRDFPVRPTRRARLLEIRALRLPFLLAEGAVIPFDLTGLRSTPDRLIRHLLGSHHDGEQFLYDLELLACHPGKLAELERAVTEIIDTDSRRSRWLRDLTVYERYHENLRDAVRRALAGELSAAAGDDPDISLAATLRWCARQPATPAATLRAWRRGELRLGPGPEVSC